MERQGAGGGEGGAAGGWEGVGGVRRGVREMKAEL